ncbi:MAG: riboflavin synthase [Spirochaetes bacterium]|nr:riboflavin synthase [Spirochaetota bacterium]
MFTGIVELTGRVQSSHGGNGASLSVSADTAFCTSLKNGDSVSINGVCQTVTDARKDGFTFFATAATLELTNLKRLHTGDTVNLERAMPATGRFDGHLVLGHIDGESTLVSLAKQADAWHAVFSLGTGWGRYLVTKGSVAVNGVSLTVYAVGETTFTIVLIPYTIKHTNLLDLSPGAYVNIEVDILAKYVERLTGAAGRNRDAYLNELLEN